MTAEFPLAVHGLVYLLHTGRVTSSSELAGNICTNPARVRKVMTKLRCAGLIQAERGQGSGYLTLPDGGRITLKAVMQALDEEPVAMKWHSGDVDMECLVASGMGEVMDEIYADMNENCMELLETITIGSISEKIFGEENTK